MITVQLEAILEEWVKAVTILWQVVHLMAMKVMIQDEIEGQERLELMR